MENLVVMNIECEGLEQRDLATILQIPVDISWQDLKLLLELHLECQDIQVKYLDDEQDVVNINRQEELCEAFKVARQCGNVLNVKAVPAEWSKKKQSADAATVMLTGSDHRAVSLLTTGQQADEAQTNSGAGGDVMMTECSETGEFEPISPPGQSDTATESQAPAPPPPVPPRILNKKPPGHKVSKNESSLLSVAREMGRQRRKRVSFQQRLDSQNHDAESGEPVGHDAASGEPVDRDASVPPQWFQLYMEKFRREITDDIAGLVCSKVVSSLDGAVVHSAAGTSGHTVSPATPDTSYDKHPVYRHTGIICDACEQTIVGVRYKCGNCDDYDLCERCEQKDGMHDPDHVFIKLRRPVLQAGRRRMARMSPVFKKSLYHAEESRMREVEGFAASQWERFQEKILKNAEKLKFMEEKFQEKVKKKEVKTKRPIEQQREAAHKKEKLDVPQCQMIEAMEAVFIRDDTFPDGSHVQPGARFLKRWMIRNTGTQPFSHDTKLSMLWGNLPPMEAEVHVPCLQPGEEGVCSVQHEAPHEPGQYQSHWRLYNKGMRFGQRLWCSVIVDEKKDPESSSEAELNVVPSSQQQNSEERTNQLVTDVSNLLTEQIKQSSADAGHTDTGHGGDVLSPRDTLSFEKLKISERSPPEVSQTATPTNTPLVVSPPKSPVPELRDLAGCQLSDSYSSVEIVADETQQTSAAALMTELVQQKMTTLDLKRDDYEDIDKEVESLSSDADSDSTDSDFFMVPLPECFQPDKPMSRAASTEGKAEVTGCAEDSHSGNEAGVLLVESDSRSAGEDVVIVETDELDASEENADDGDVLIVDVTDYVPVKSGFVNDSADTAIKVLSSDETPQREPLSVPQTLASGQHGDEENNNNPVLLAVCVETESAQTDEVDAGQKEVKVTRSQTPPSPGAGAGNLVTSAVNVTSHSAAQKVLHTLHAQNQYVPPYSNWKPQGQHYTLKKNMWTPSKETYVPPKSVWTPSKDTYVPPKSEWTPPTQTWTSRMANSYPEKKELGPIEKLFEMGFCNRDRNRRLLEKHNNIVEKVIQELLSDDNTSWFQNRH